MTNEKRKRVRRRRRANPLVELLVGIAIAFGVIIGALMLVVYLVDDFNSLGELVNYIIRHVWREL